MNQNPMGGGLLDLMGGGMGAPAPAAPASGGAGLDALGLFSTPTTQQAPSNKVTA